jgi:hypothetical protein
MMLCIIAIAVTDSSTHFNSFEFTFLLNLFVFSLHLP